MIIDTHCHIYNSEMENAEEIIKEAAKENIGYSLTVASRIAILETASLLASISVLIY